MASAETAGLGTTHVSFGDVELDVGAMDIRRAGARVPVEPQVFDVLRYLLQHRDRVVTKEELLDEVWGNRFVSESALTSRIRSARLAVGDDGQRQGVIRTVHGRGYQFVAQLRSHTGSPEAHAALADAGPGGPSPRFASRLPAPAKPLVDRVTLSELIRSRIQGGRVVTLVGPAGVGKTLLAQHVAASCAPRFPDGAWGVRLDEVRQAAGIGQAVLDALRATRFPSGTVEETVTSILSGTNGLLLLDNCEHLLLGVSDLVRQLLTNAGPLAILATSRQRLGIAGEVIVDVPVLAPEHGQELFATRATEHGLQLTPDSGTVAELCEALDQLPLALELACAHARVLGVDQLAGLLDRRMQLLRGAPGEPRALTLEGAIETSFSDLEPGVRETLGRFSAFAGWFDLEAATAVATAGRDMDTIDAVQHVVALGERSLLDVHTGGPVTRYRLLESIRLFAQERLADPVPVRRAHVLCYRDRALAQGVRLAGPEVEGAWLQIRQDWTNYRAAVRRALDLGMVEDALAIINATVDYAEVALAFEHGLWADAALGLAEATGATGPAVLEARAGRARLLSYELRLDEQSELALGAGDPEVSYSAALARFWKAGAHGELADIKRYFTLLERHTAGTGGIRELTVGAISHLAAHNPMVDPTAASLRALRIGRATGDVGRVFALAIEANLALRSGRLDDALAACTECIDGAEPLAMAVLSSQAQALKVRAVRSHDDIQLVGRCVLEAMRHYRSRGNWASARNDAPVAARVVAEAGMHAEAADILDGYRPVRYRSVGPEYVAAVRAVTARTLGSGLDALVRPGADENPERFCDFVLTALAEAVTRLTGSAT